MHIRHFQSTDADYDAITAIEKAIWGDIADSKKEFQHGDATRNPDFLFRRLIVEWGGAPAAFAAYGESSWSHQPGKYFININVHPEFERRGIGTAVYTHIWENLQHRDPAPTLLTSYTYNHKPQGIRFLTKRGFKQVMRWINSELDTNQFAAEAFSTLGQRIARDGIIIRTLPEQQQIDPNWARALYELDWVLSQDEPSPQPFTKISFADYQKQILKEPNLIEEAWLVAMVGDAYVGMTQLYRNENNAQKLNTGFTGVTRPYRRRGLATYLKARAIQYAKENGYVKIRTGNEENNPMYTLNRKLGFADVSSFMAFQKEIGSRK